MIRSSREQQSIHSDMAPQLQEQLADIQTPFPFSEIGNKSAIPGIPFSFKDLKEGSFLPSNQNIEKDRKFLKKLDTLEHYNNTRKAFGNAWKYSNKSISYNTNRLGYRTKEFEEIDWANSIVLFGCSHVFGAALAEDETISHHLTSITGIPVINMGAMGSSIQHTFYNNITLRKHYPTPKAVLNLWTSVDRHLLFVDSVFFNVGNWTLSEVRDERINNTSNILTHSLYQIQATRLLWSGVTRYTDWSLYKITADMLDMSSIRFVDQARDGIHPGSATCYRVAQYFAQQLQL